ncbi:MAG: hypothetical protein WD397_05820 [Wenzhouxiangellaceae bacterium]
MNIANLIDVALLISGLIVLVIGYRSNNRNLLLLAAILLLFSCALTEFATGFAEGLTQTGN